MLIAHVASQKLRANRELCVWLALWGEKETDGGSFSAFSNLTPPFSAWEK